jgi:hypothetical protein
MLGIQSSEPVVSLESIMDYISDVEKHHNELTATQKKVRKDEIDEREAEKQNTHCLILFHEKLTLFLKYNNIRILTKEERKAETKMEAMLSTILNV